MEIDGITASLLDFEDAEPTTFPTVPKLAKKVIYRWELRPETLPRGARPAALVQDWKAVDEWGSRQVQLIRDSLSKLEEGEAGLIARLRRWLPSSKNEATERRHRILDKTDELGESRLSDVPEEAGERASELTGLIEQVQQLFHESHQAKQSAEDAEAEEEQRTKWETRVDESRSQMDSLLKQLGDLEPEIDSAQKEERSALEMQEEELGKYRAERREKLEEEIDSIEEFFDEFSPEEIDQLPKKQRKERKREEHRKKQRLDQLQKDLSRIEKWAPSSNLMKDTNELVEETQQALHNLKEQQSKLTEEIQGCRKVVDSEFSFEPPPRLNSPAAITAQVCPQVPEEGLPELGELYEHKGKRFLAVKTWEQVRRAAPVANRLDATLVALPQPSK